MNGHAEVVALLLQRRSLGVLQRIFSPTGSSLQFFRRLISFLTRAKGVFVQVHENADVSDPFALTKLIHTGHSCVE